MLGGLSIGTLAVLVVLAIFLLNWIKVLNEYERGVVFVSETLASAQGSRARNHFCSHRSHGED